MVTGRFSVLQHLFDRFGLDSALASNCAGQVRNMYLEAGTALQSNNAEAGSLFYLASGLVVSTVGEPGSGRRPHVVMAYDSDTWLCTQRLVESYLQTESSYDVNYIAATDIGLVIIEAGLAQLLMERQNDFRNFVLKTCMTEAASLARMLINFKFAGTVYRLVFGLAMLADTFCNRHRDVTNLHRVSHIPDVSIAVTQSMLGDICGVSRSSMAPILTELKTHGWVDMTYGNTVIRKPLAWCRLLDSLKEKKSLNESFSLDDALVALSASRAPVQDSARQTNPLLAPARTENMYQ